MNQSDISLSGVRIEPYSFFEELGSAEFGDQRRTDRLINIMDDLYKHPSLPVNAACGSWNKAKAAYRFIASAHVKGDQMFAPHFDQTTLRMRQYSTVVISQDTSSLNYSSHLSTKGLGSIGIGHSAGKGRGIFLHTSEAFSEAGVPLGIVDQIMWSRLKKHKAPQKEPESNRWLLSLDTLHFIQEALPETRIIVVSDRESDFNEYLLQLKAQHLKGVVRVKANLRRDTEGHVLKDVMNEGTFVGQAQITVRQIRGKTRINKKTKPVPRHNPREQRQANLEIRVKKVTLRESTPCGSEEDRTFWGVWVNEINPPEGFEAVQWLLLTNEDLSSDEKTKAIDVINWYKLRWGIEIFHKILKSGCQVEMAEFETIDRLKKYILMMSLIAWKIHTLVYAQREEPDAPCTQILSPQEWQILYLVIHDNAPLPEKTPSIKEATVWIARLGGFLARKCDGNPGPLTLWRGWQRLVDLTLGSLARQSTHNAPQSLG